MTSEQIDSSMMWMVFLEKAMAKIYGTYERLEHGSAGEVYPQITGAPSVSYNHKQVAGQQNIYDFEKILLEAG